MSALPHLRRGPLLGGYSFVDEAEGEILVVRGWRLEAPASTGALSGRWYIANRSATKRLGNPDGYRTLREIREHLSAVDVDRANGYEARWGA